jgi:DNA-binding LacI/PurR family transcriptional regulator
MSKPVDPSAPAARRINLKLLGEHLRLSPSTISFVLNNAPGRSIPEVTRERVRKAAAELNYQPSVIARTLRGQRMQTVGILLPELGEGYHSRVMSGIGDMLMAQQYFYFTVQHRHKAKLIAAYPYLLQARGVDGLLAIDTHLTSPLPLPTVLIAGHTELPDVANVMLDHELAAKLALEHLYKLGHRKIVFMKGQSFSTDTELRWQATMRVAEELGLTVDRRLVVQLIIDSTSPEISYPRIQELLTKHRDFTAILCFNDVSAMGSIRALHDGGLRVPEDVSVLGFDDIQSASFHVPSITTIRQPLKTMGSTAAAALLRKLAGESLPSILWVEPELIIRESTAPVKIDCPKMGGKSRRGSRQSQPSS